MESNNELIGFVPPGHARIVPIRVIAAWLHEESGAWLSIQAMGPAMGLVWRSCDSWAATPHLIYVVCNSLIARENYEAACRLAEVYLDEGPPPTLMASARRSAEARAAKHKAEALAKYQRQSKPLERPPTH